MGEKCPGIQGGGGGGEGCPGVQVEGGGGEGGGDCGEGVLRQGVHGASGGVGGCGGGGATSGSFTPRQKYGAPCRAAPAVRRRTAPQPPCTFTSSSWWASRGMLGVMVAVLGLWASPSSRCSWPGGTGGAEGEGEG